MLHHLIQQRQEQQQQRRTPPNSNLFAAAYNAAACVLRRLELTGDLTVLKGVCELLTLPQMQEGWPPLHSLAVLYASRHGFTLGNNVEGETAFNESLAEQKDVERTARLAATFVLDALMAVSNDPALVRQVCQAVQEAKCAEQVDETVKYAARVYAEVLG